MTEVLLSRFFSCATGAILSQSDHLTWLTNAFCTRYLLSAVSKQVSKYLQHLWRYQAWKRVCHSKATQEVNRLLKIRRKVSLWRTIRKTQARPSIYCKYNFISFKDWLNRVWKHFLLWRIISVNLATGVFQHPKYAPFEEKVLKVVSATSKVKRSCLLMGDNWFVDFTRILFRKTKLELRSSHIQF